MNVNRLIEIAACFLSAFIVISIISFVSLRPFLLDIREEVAADWKAFQDEAGKRSRALSGLAQAIRSYSVGREELADKLLGARLATSSSGDPDKLVAVVDETDRLLARVEHITQSGPDITVYPPFARYWEEIRDGTLRIGFKRELYNRNVAKYNGLLTLFPQNLVATAFGFVPLKSYPIENGAANQWRHDQERKNP